MCHITLTSHLTTSIFPPSLNSMWQFVLQLSWISCLSLWGLVTFQPNLHFVWLSLLQLKANKTVGWTDGRTDRLQCVLMPLCTYVQSEETNNKWSLHSNENYTIYSLNVKTTQTRGVSSSQFVTVSPVVSREPQEPLCDPTEPMLIVSTGLPLPDDNIPFSMRRVACCSCRSRSYNETTRTDNEIHQTFIITPQAYIHCPPPLQQHICQQWNKTVQMQLFEIVTCGT